MELSIHIDMQKSPENVLSLLLEGAEQAARQGDREKAYRSSLQATNLAPREPLGWYLRSHSAPSTEEKLVCLSRLYSLDPDFPLANGEMHIALGDLLQHDPSLVYVDETQELYYPAIIRALGNAGYRGYIAHEFLPRGEPLTALRRAYEICYIDTD